MYRCSILRTFRLSGHPSTHISLDNRRSTVYGDGFSKIGSCTCIVVFKRAADVLVLFTTVTINPLKYLISCSNTCILSTCCPGTYILG